MDKSHLRIKLKMDPPKMYNKINKQNHQNYPITGYLLFWGNTGKQLELKRLQFRNAADYIYIYAFSRRFYPKRLCRYIYSGYTFCFCQYVFPENQTHNLCAANVMLYHWATGTLDYSPIHCFKTRHFRSVLLVVE